MGRLVVAAAALALMTPAVSSAASADSPAASKRIVRQWSTRLNAGDNTGIARLFGRPAVFVQGASVLELRTTADITRWHASLPCAGRITSMTVDGQYVTAVFVLRNGKGRRCDAPGNKAAAVFRIRGGKIHAWIQTAVPEPKEPAGPVA